MEKPALWYRFRARKSEPQGSQSRHFCLLSRVGRVPKWSILGLQIGLCAPDPCALISPVSTGMGILIFIAVAAFLAGPILAIMALVAVRRMEGEPLHLQIPQLTSRIYSLEKRLLALEQALLHAAPAESKPETAKAGMPLPPGDLADKVRIAEPLSVPAGVEASAPPPLAPVVSGHAEVSGILPADRAARVSASHAIGAAYAKSAAPVDLENRIAGNWFNRIGIVAMLIAISSGLKWAFDNNWIGPSGRVAIGVLLGALMLPWSQWLLGKGYGYFSEGIAALGEATLFLSVWAGCQYYTLYSRDVGFVAMIVITA